jgi:hypothetical protein
MALYLTTALGGPEKPLEENRFMCLEKSFEPLAQTLLTATEFNLFSNP